MKKLWLGLSVLVFGLVLASCTATDELGLFQRTVSDQISIAERFEAVPSDQVNNQMIQSLSSSEVVTLSTTLTTGDEMTNREKIDLILSLFDEVAAIHQDNVARVEEVKASYQTLKDHVTSFRDNELSLTDQDKETVTRLRLEFGLRKLEIKDTIGDVSALVDDIKANFNLDSLDLIISDFEQIKDILTFRNTFLIDLQAGLVEIDTIVTAYLQ